MFSSILAPLDGHTLAEQALPEMPDELKTYFEET